MPRPKKEPNDESSDDNWVPPPLHPGYGTKRPAPGVDQRPNKHGCYSREMTYTILQNTPDEHMEEVRDYCMHGYIVGLSTKDSSPVYLVNPVPQHSKDSHIYFMCVFCGYTTINFGTIQKHGKCQAWKDYNGEKDENPWPYGDVDNVNINIPKQFHRDLQTKLRTQILDKYLNSKEFYPADIDFDAPDAEERIIEHCKQRIANRKKTDEKEAATHSDDDRKKAATTADDNQKKAPTKSDGKGAKKKPPAKSTRKKKATTESDSSVEFVCQRQGIKKKVVWDEDDEDEEETDSEEEMKRPRKRPATRSTKSLRPTPANYDKIIRK